MRSCGNPASFTTRRAGPARSRGSGRPSLRYSVIRPSFKRFKPSTRPHPHAAVAGRQHRPGRAFRQPVVRGNGRDGGVAKAVEPVVGRDPDVAFAILEEVPDVVAGQAVSLRKQVDPVPMDAKEPPVEGADPQGAVAIPEHVRELGVQRGRSTGGYSTTFSPTSCLRPVSLGDHERTLVRLDDARASSRSLTKRIALRTGRVSTAIVPSRDPTQRLPARSSYTELARTPNSPLSP